MLAKIWSCSLVGLKTHLVLAEIDISSGLPAFEIVGLASKAVREAKERVRTALHNSGYEFPYQRITVNLAPADLPKEGTGFDLPIAIGILLATGQISLASEKEILAMGELSLMGDVRAIPGILPMAMDWNGEFVLPWDNYAEASLVKNADLWPIKHLHDLEKEKKFPVIEAREKSIIEIGDFSEIKGQMQAKRALEIAAAGFHNVIMMGPPGCGKTMLAERFSTILPSLSQEEMLEVTKIKSIAGILKEGEGLSSERPYRHPHHTCSIPAMLGGTNALKPGEVTLAHDGVLFLDEIAEFKRDSLEGLRQVIENREIVLTKNNRSCVYPASFMLIGAANKCPCGRRTEECTCSPREIQRYFNKLSGPLWERFDIHLDLPPLETSEILSKGEGEKSSVIRSRVEQAVLRQRERFKGTDILHNAELNGGEIEKYCRLSPEAKLYLELLCDNSYISARSYSRILKVALTIADLAGEDIISSAHLAEAVQYRDMRG